MEQFYYWILYFSAAAATFAVAVYSFSRRHNRGAGGLIVLCLSTGFWAVCEGMLYFGWDTLTNVRIAQIQYLGIVVSPLAMVFFVTNLFGMGRRLPAGMAVFLFVPPAATLLLVWTNDFHHLIWSEYRNITDGPFPALGLTHGPAFYGWVGYSYLLIIAMTGLLIHQARRATGPIRAQAVIILGALGVVWAANGVYVSGMSPLAHVDPTPVAFAVLAAAMAWALFRHGLLDLSPVARDEVFFSMPDGVVVMDRDARVLDLNPAAEGIFGFSSRAAVGKTMTALGVDKMAAPDLHFGEEGHYREITVGDGGAGRVFDIRTSILRGEDNRPLGLVQVWHDVSDRKVLERRLERMARTDFLTGSYNRRHFMDLVRNELQRAIRYDHPLSMAFMDIDHFKKVNDTYGHAVGDDVLKAVADACRHSLRETDVFARVGGEEFAFLYLETDLEEAAQAAERLRKRLAASPLQVGNQAVSITVSLGVTARMQPNDRLKTLFQRADTAMYEAKAAGRNRVAVKRVGGLRAEVGSLKTED
jgi:diguanylate cyclase (GGDEF)-like protein/PAS domain S-box-containing protein